MSSKTTDFLIVGAGIIGLAVARELKSRFPEAGIVILEKENGPGFHASGRNSGVLHAGLYYEASSLKARFCREGGRMLREYCQQREIPLFKAGKVVVSVGPAAKTELEALQQRAISNGARVELIDQKQLLEIEPACVPVAHALYSPDTSAVEPRLILGALEEDLRAAGIEIIYGCQFRFYKNAQKEIQTESGTIGFSYLINCAGAGSLALAQSCGIGEGLRLLPFRGSYYEVISSDTLIRGNIYPVPDPRFPFLGVHLSRAVSGRVFAGPTAWPVLGAEHYAGMRGINLKSLIDSAKILGAEYLTNRGGMRAHMHREAAMTIKSNYLKKLQEIVPAIRMEHLKSSEKRGIRAQLYSLETKSLVQDFLVETAENSLHVLNTVSPGFTSAFSFAAHIVDLATTAKAGC